MRPSDAEWAEDEDILAVFDKCDMPASGAASCETYDRSRSKQPSDFLEFQTSTFPVSHLRRQISCEECQSRASMRTVPLRFLRIMDGHPGKCSDGVFDARDLTSTHNCELKATC